MFDFRMDLPSVFPDTSAEVRPVSQTQLRRWRNRFIRLTKPTSATVAAAAPVVPARAVSA